MLFITIRKVVFGTLVGGVLGLALNVTGCISGGNDESLSESHSYSYQEDTSFKDTIQVWDFAWLTTPDTIPWLNYYDSDSLTFTHRYDVNRSENGIVREDYLLYLYFAVPAVPDTFLIDAINPEKVRLSRSIEGTNGFKPVLEASISGWKTGTSTWYAAGRAIYSLASDPDSVNIAGRDTILFQGNFKLSTLYD